MGNLKLSSGSVRANSPTALYYLVSAVFTRMCPTHSIRQSSQLCKFHSIFTLLQEASC